MLKFSWNPSLIVELVVIFQEIIDSHKGRKETTEN
jgi:hypothetical protein